MRKPALPAFLSRPIRVFILEMIPQILVSDGFNFIEAVFTKESINEFRKNFSHCKFSSLKDKVIYLSKWSLFVDTADSKQVYNSFNNVTIKLVVESFKPISHEQVNHRHITGVQSIFRDEKIQNLIRNFRHWFYQQTINKNAITPTEISVPLPSFQRVQVKKQPMIEMPKLSDLKEPKSKEAFEVDIQNANVFRISGSPEDILSLNNLKQDCNLEMHQFINEIHKRKELQIKDMRFYNVDQLIIQEQGERFFKENRMKKDMVWRDKVEDEIYREALKLKIEYF